MRECSPKPAGQKRKHVSTKLESSLMMAFYRITFLRSFLKWLVRKITGMCELQRIVRKYKLAERTMRIEQCLLLSKSKILQDAVNDSDAETVNIPALVTQIMQIKSIIPETDPPFEEALTVSLTQIKTYKCIFDEVELLRKTPYDCKNSDHEEMLMKLWKLLKPDDEIESRISKRWCELGFQGSDPMTDFRGMGILGLRCMLHFAEMHNDKALQLLQHSHHPVYGYSFAIVGINMTSLVYEFLQSGKLRTHFYNEIQGRPAVSDFLDVFSCVFSQFDNFWLESKPENVMAFSRIRENFSLQLTIHLSAPIYGSIEIH